MTSQSNVPAVSRDARGYRRQLRNYLLDRNLQLRFAVVISGICAVLTTGLGALMYYFHREASAVVAVRALDPDDPLAGQLAASMLRNDHLLLFALVAFGVLLCGILLGAGIIYTHSVAGPLYKISTYMTKIEQGKLGRVYDLRRGDQLTQFFGVFRRMHGALTRRTREDADRLRALADELDAAGKQDVAERIRAIVREKEESLA